VIKSFPIIVTRLALLTALSSACALSSKHAAKSDKEIVYSMAYDGTNEEIEKRINRHLENKNCLEKEIFFKEILEAEFDGESSYLYNVEENVFGVKMVTTTLVFHIFNNRYCKIEAQRQGL
jgi:hypothetical protein